MKDLVLVESRTAREQVIGQCGVLDKVKALPSLTVDARSTIRQAAEYYEVSDKTIKRLLSKNKAEFQEDGIEILCGDDLKELKLRDTDVLQLGKRAKSLTLLSKRAMLRLGMLLTESEIAKMVRNYLLNIEETSTQEQKEWAFKREVGKLRRRLMTDAIRDYIEESPNKKWRYVHFTELVYKKAFGKSTKELCLERCVRDKDQLRDSLSAEELDLLEKAEVFVAGLIMAGNSYQEIKSMVNGLQLLPKGVVVNG